MSHRLRRKLHAQWITDSEPQINPIQPDFTRTESMDQITWELILDQGTVKSSATAHRPELPVGGLTRDGQPHACPANEMHSEMTSGNHKAFNAGKPQPKLSDVNDLKKVFSDHSAVLLTKA